nr:hypothetical protein [Tanacetum cinerariifolium]
MKGSDDGDGVRRMVVVMKWVVVVEACGSGVGDEGDDVVAMIGYAMMLMVWIRWPEAASDIVEERGRFCGHFPISCVLYYDVAPQCYRSDDVRFRGVTDWYHEPSIMDASPSPNHVFNFPEVEFEEDPQEEPEEEFEEDPEEDPEAEAEDDVPPPATPPVGSPITPPPLFDNVVEHRVTDLENKEQEKAEEMDKMKKRLGTLEANYSLVLSDRDEWRKAFLNLQAWVFERLGRGALDARPDVGEDGPVSFEESKPPKPPGSPSSSSSLIMPPKMMKRKAVNKIVKKQIAEAIEEYKMNRVDLGNASGSGEANTGGPVTVQGCTYKTFINGKPHPFNGTEGVVGLRRWIEKVEQVFKICKCAEEDKVMFAASTFKGRALTWWNGNVHTLGLVNANRIPWTEFKSMMTTEYCPATEIQKMEEELWTLTLKGDDIEAYNNRFHELALMCPNLVPNEKKKID